jgi:hypothetical protein
MMIKVIKMVTNNVFEYLETIDTIKKYQDLRTHAMNIATEVAVIRGMSDRGMPLVPDKSSVVTFDEEENSVTVSWDIWFRGQITKATVEFPIPYLWDENYKELEQTVENKRRQKIMEHAREQVEKAAMEIEEKEKQELIRLAKKYWPNVVDGDTIRLIYPPQS